MKDRTLLIFAQPLDEVTVQFVLECAERIRRCGPDALGRLFEALPKISCCSTAPLALVTADAEVPNKLCADCRALAGLRSFVFAVREASGDDLQPEGNA